MIGFQNEAEKKGRARTSKRDGQQNFGSEKIFEMSWGIKESYRRTDHFE